MIPESYDWLLSNFPRPSIIHMTMFFCSYAHFLYDAFFGSKQNRHKMMIFLILNAAWDHNEHWFASYSLFET